MIKQYTKKDGTKAWMFKTYLGKNQLTGKKMWTTRRGFETKKACQLAEKRLLLDVEEHGFKKQQSDTFEDVYNLWFDMYQHTVKESTWYKTKEMFIIHILPRFGHLQLDNINVQSCQKAVNEWLEVAPSRYLRMKNYMANVFDYAISLELTEKNPMKKIKNPVLKKNYEEEEELNFYSKEELKKFLQVLKEVEDPIAYYFFYLLAFTGMRKGEAFALTWSDINFKDSTVTINKTLTRGDNARLYITTPKTRKSARTISLDPQTVAMLKEWRSRQKRDYMKFGFNTLKPDQLVFSNGIRVCKEFCVSSFSSNVISHSIFKKYDEL